MCSDFLESCCHRELNRQRLHNYMQVKWKTDTMVHVACATGNWPWKRVLTLVVVTSRYRVTEMELCCLPCMRALLCLVVENMCHVAQAALRNMCQKPGQAGGQTQSLLKKLCAQPKAQPNPPTAMNLRSNYLPPGILQGLVPWCKLSDFTLCWSDYTPPSIDKLRLVSTALLLRELPFKKFKKCKVWLTKLAVVHSYTTLSEDTQE